jgi:cell division protease FtsH
MELKRLSRATLLLAPVALLLLLFALDHTNSTGSYRQASPSAITSLINHGQVNNALISDRNQLIQITTKSGKQFQASWVSGQGLPLQNALQAQLAKGSLPGGYSVSIAQSSTLPLDVLIPALIYLVIFVLFFWFIDYPTGIKRWTTSANVI